jgi:chromosome segregation ATPase
VKKLTKTKSFLAVACALAMAPVLSAQQPAGAPAGAAPAPAEKKFYEDLIKTPIVPQRSAAEIQNDLKTAQDNMKEADKAISGAQARIKEADGWIATNKKDMDAQKAKRDAANKEKREADKITLEGQLKQMDLVDQYLKKTKDIRSTELDFAKSQKELVGAQIKAYQSEAELNKKAEAIKSAGPDSLSKTVTDAAQASEATLKLMKTMAEKNEDMLGQMKKLADRRIDLVQARNKLLTQDRINDYAAGLKKK